MAALTLEPGELDELARRIVREMPPPRVHIASEPPFISEPALAERWSAWTEAAALRKARLGTGKLQAQDGGIIQLPDYVALRHKVAYCFRRRRDRRTVLEMEDNGLMGEPVRLQRQAMTADCPEMPPRTFVYFVAAGTEAIKIGFAQDVGRRLASIQSNNHQQLILLGAVEGGRALEQALHQMLADSSLGGEWFAYSEDNIRRLERVAAGEMPWQR